MEYYERNLAAFADNVSAGNKQQYQAFKRELRQAAIAAPLKTGCFRVLTYYVEFFKDNHASIYMGSDPIDEDNVEAVNEFLSSDLYQSREMHQLSESDVQQYPLDDLRGIYQAGNAYKIAVIPSKTPFRDYVGVILESQSKLWKRGQVKLEIKQVGPNHYQTFSYMRNHSLSFSGRYQLKNGILGDTWVKTIKEGLRNYATDAEETFQFKMLDDSTAYLRLPSFTGYIGAQIDSLYQVADEQIRQTPNLIIDVRNNGGGSDSNASPLLPYIYTKPIKGDRVELWVTEDNIKLWKNWQSAWKADSLNYSRGELKWISNEIRRMEKVKPNTWIVRSK
ncbi:MAG: S41 family peptidase, partial [Bacteroidota bacterium]